MWAYVRALGAMRALRQARQEMYSLIAASNEPEYAYIIVMYDVRNMYWQGKLTRTAYMYIDWQIANIRNELNGIIATSRW